MFALVTGVQTCALPISLGRALRVLVAMDVPNFIVQQRCRARRAFPQRREAEREAEVKPHRLANYIGRETVALRSEERRQGHECVSTCRFRRSPYPITNKRSNM